MNRRGFLAKILVSAVAAPAVTKLIAGGAKQEARPMECRGFSGAVDVDSVGIRPDYYPAGSLERAYLKKFQDDVNADIRRELVALSRVGQLGS